jgi:response regulator RpfG family c-di-GMP phosphodiesterase
VQGRGEDRWAILAPSRSYRQSWSQEKTVSIIKKNRGALFKGEIVDCFLDLIDRGIVKADPQARYEISTLWKKCSPDIPAAFAG